MTVAMAASRKERVNTTVYYLPDFEARVLEPAKLLFENGYKGTFIKEVISESL